MTHLEYLAEVNNTSFDQNAEWFSNDLKLYHRPKRVKMNIGINASKTIQITFDSGSSWTDFASSKKLDFKDEVTFIISPDDLVNFRCTDGSGVTINHMHIYFKEF